MSPAGVTVMVCELATLRSNTSIRSWVVPTRSEDLLPEDNVAFASTADPGVVAVPEVRVAPLATATLPAKLPNIRTVLLLDT